MGVNNFVKGSLIVFCLCLLSTSGFAHEGHHHLVETNLAEVNWESYISLWLGRIGRFHLLLLHFPIALIIMTVIAEWLWIWFANPIFRQAARFMILAAAIFAVPTALLGLAYGYGQIYQEPALDLYQWHRLFGLTTAGLAVLTAALREGYEQTYLSSQTGYYFCLFMLFICINLTGTFGGGLAFGLSIW